MTAAYKKERQAKKQIEEQLTNLQEEMADLKTANNNLNKVGLI